jgi:hypothetical protein
MHMNKSIVGVIAATHLATFVIGYSLAPRELLDEEVKNAGYFTVDTTKILSATVASLREENKLLVYSYKGTATVTASRKALWFLNGRQKIIVPAVVNYTMDLSDLSLTDVSYEDSSKLVTVKLPRLTIGDIAFQPEEATTINGGLLTFSEEQTEELRKLNYASARRAMIKQAQQAGFVKIAKMRAKDNVESYFTIPLRLAGMPSVRVVATFD